MSSTCQSRLLAEMLAVISACSSLSAFSANVLWDQADIYDEGMDGQYHRYTFGGPYLQLLALDMSTGLELHAIAESNLQSANTFALASVGDNVNDSYIENKGVWFAYARYGVEHYDDAHSDYTIILQDEPVYLAFRYEGATSSSYGWAEIGFDTSGNLAVLHSAWDLDGGSLVVGAIPEPSSVLLLSLGLALLSLRRGGV